MAPSFDLQSHSTFSDGELSPAEVVAVAATVGVELLALTDHDSVDGVDEALGAAAAEGIGLVPAAELSAVFDGQEDLHVLGYRIDHRDPVLKERTALARNERVSRAAAMGERLRSLGFAVDEHSLEQRRAAGLAIGRPHLAAAVVGHPNNAERLRSERVERVEEFIPAYLIPGAPAYLPRTSPTVGDAIGWIHDAGGVAIWAHPFWDDKGDDEVLATIEGFQGLGLDGVECFYPTHTEAQTALLVERCERLGILRTGSSDFHGPTHKIFSRFGAFELYGYQPELGPIASG